MEWISLETVCLLFGMVSNAGMIRACMETGSTVRDGCGVFPVDGAGRRILSNWCV